MDEELIGQMREVSGGSTMRCDLCGMPHAAATMLVVSGRRPSGEPVDRVRACPACRAQLEADEAPFEAVAEAGRFPRADVG